MLGDIQIIWRDRQRGIKTKTKNAGLIFLFHFNLHYNKQSFIYIGFVQYRNGRGMIGPDSVSGHGAVQPVCEYAGLKQEKGKHGWKFVNSHFTSGYVNCMVFFCVIKHNNDKETYFYLGIDTGVIFLCTPKAPGHNTLQLPVTYNRTTRVTLRKRETWNLTHVRELSLN